MEPTKWLSLIHICFCFVWRRARKIYRDDRRLSLGLFTAGFLLRDFEEEALACLSFRSAGAAAVPSLRYNSVFTGFREWVLGFFSGSFRALSDQRYFIGLSGAAPGAEIEKQAFIPIGAVKKL